MNFIRSGCITIYFESNNIYKVFTQMQFMKCGNASDQKVSPHLHLNIFNFLLIMNDFPHSPHSTWIRNCLCETRCHRKYRHSECVPNYAVGLKLLFNSQSILTYFSVFPNVPSDNPVQLNYFLHTAHWCFPSVNFLSSSKSLNALSLVFHRKELFHVRFRFQVSLKSTFLSECFATPVAFKWFLSCVNPGVHCELTLGRKGIVTDSANEGFYCCVCHYMCSKATCMSKHRSTCHI